MTWLLVRKSATTLENKFRLYKAILKPVWTYGIQLWKILQRYQLKNI